jgi:hypothetical protein
MTAYSVKEMKIYKRSVKIERTAGGKTAEQEHGLPFTATTVSPSRSSIPSLNSPL